MDFLTEAEIDPFVLTRPSNEEVVWGGIVCCAQIEESSCCSSLGRLKDPTSGLFHFFDL